MKNSKPIALDRRDIHSLLDLIGGFGAVVAVGIIAMLSVCAAFFIYRSFRGQRGKGDENNGNETAEATVEGSSARRRKREGGDDRPTESTGKTGQLLKHSRLYWCAHVRGFFGTPHIKYHCNRLSHVTAINAVNGEKLSRVSGPRRFWPVRKLSQSETFSACLLFCSFTDRNVVLAMDYVIDSVIIMFLNYFSFKFRSHCLLCASNISLDTATNRIWCQALKLLFLIQN